MPSNLISAFSEGETLQVVFVALIIGTAAYSLGDKAAPFVYFHRAAFEVIQRVLGWIIRLAPLGTLGLIGNAVASYGNEFFVPLLKLIGSTYVACALVLFAVYPLLLALVAKVSPIRFSAKSWKRAAVRVRLPVLRRQPPAEPADRPGPRRAAV